MSMVILPYPFLFLTFFLNRKAAQNNLLSYIRGVAEERQQLDRVNLEKLAEFCGIATKHNPTAYLSMEGMRIVYSDDFDKAMIAFFAAVFGFSLEALPTIRNGTGPVTKAQRQLIYSQMKNDTTLLFSLLLPIMWDRIDFQEVLTHILLLYHTWEDAMKQPGFGIYIDRDKLDFLDNNPTKEQVRRPPSHVSFNPHPTDMECGGSGGVCHSVVSY